MRGADCVVEQYRCQQTDLGLTEDKFKHIAIADPSRAVWQTCRRSLTAGKLWDTVKLVYGENISQTAVRGIRQCRHRHYRPVAGITQNCPSKGYHLIDDKLHKPLEQAFIVTTHGKDNAAAQRFANYMQAPEARKVMVKYGFVLPGESADAADKPATTSAQ